MKNISMDHVDLQLLSLLQRNAKLSYSQLGKHVGLAVSTITERLKKLHAQHVIRDYVTRIDPKALGYDICAFVLVFITKPEQEIPFVDRVNELPEVQECHFVTGEFSYLLKVRTQDTLHLEAFLQEKLMVLPGVGRTNTMIALTTSKETTAVDIPLNSTNGRTS